MMAAIAAQRDHLQRLKLIVDDAEKAIERADKAEYALQRRQEKRDRRRYSVSDSDDEDESLDGEDEMENDEARDDASQGASNPKNKPGDEDFADEEEEGFDYDAKSERFQQETIRCKIDTEKVQRLVL